MCIILDNTIQNNVINNSTIVQSKAAVSIDKKKTDFVIGGLLV